MIDFTEQTFLYQEPIFVIDNKNTLSDKVPKDVITEYRKNERIIKSFYIQFSQKIPDKMHNNNNSLFTSFKIDHDVLKQFKLKDWINPTTNKKIKIIYLPNLCLPNTISIKTLQYIVGYLFDVNNESLLIYHDYNNGNLNLFSNEPRDFMHNEADYIYAFEKTMYKLDNIEHVSQNIVYNSMSIGFNKNWKIISISTSASSIGNYEEMFYKDYCQTVLYIKKILDNVEKLNIKKLPVNISYNTIKVVLAYHAPQEVFSSIDIYKLFNIHHPWNYSKIYVHSDNVDNFNNNPRPMQYVKYKGFNDVNVFKGIDSIFNACCLYCGTDLGHGLVLHHLEIFPCMDVNLVFTNVNMTATWDEITSYLKQYIDNNYISILKKAKINEAIYNLNFDYKYYIPYLGGINGTINILSLSVSDIENINSILQQETPNLRFKTRTSIELNGYGIHSVSLKERFSHIFYVHEVLTQSIVYKEILPSFHVGLTDDNNGVLTFKDVNTYEEMIFNVAMLIGQFKKLNHNLAIHNSEAVKAIQKSNQMDIESIRKNCSKYGKNLLKLLEKMDPRLFGPRKVGKGSRSFSGLCQKQKQRVVPITKDEYEYLYNIVPNSVANIQNQSYPEQRIYLFCADKKYPFLNYHIFPHQLCIIRCTTKQSNKTQYNFCAKSLNAEHLADIQNKYENQTITLYNPLITKGRKCKLPDEFKMILVDYVLIKLNIEESIYKFCMDNYNKQPFIIERDPVNSRYLLLVEYNANVDYVLIIQAEMNGGIFMVINEKTNEPLVFSKSPEIMKFFVENIRKTSNQYNFFNFLELIFNDKLSDKYTLMIREIIDYVYKQYNVKYITQNDDIIGIIWNNKMYLTPKMFWKFEDDRTYTIPLFKAVGEVINGKLMLPNITDLKSDYVTTLYCDYKQNNSISMVNYRGIDMLVDPFEVSAKWSSHDIITFDSKTVMMNIYNINIERNTNIKENQIKILDIAEVLRNYIYIYLIENDKIDTNEILRILKELGVVYEKSTFIDYVDNKFKKDISWRTSKINEKDFNEYFERYADLTNNEIIKTIYKKFQDDLTFTTSKNESISSKIITI